MPLYRSIPLPVPVSNGGTGASTFNAGAYIKMGATTFIGQALPIPIAHGGTNSIDALINSRVMTSVGDAIVESGAITDGQTIQRSGATFISTPLPLSTMEGRLTLTSATPITTADVTAAGTIYYTPYKGNQLTLYNGSIWKRYTFTQLSLALTLTDAKNYDVFVYDNGGPTLELSAAWTDDTTRADTLTLTNGVYVKSASTLRRYIGTIRASGTDTTEDSIAKRFVWNMYNRVERLGYAEETTDSWTYTTAAFRETNAGSTPGTSRVDYVAGLSEDLVDAIAKPMSYNASGVSTVAGIGIDSSTVNSALMFYNGAGIAFFAAPSFYSGYPGLGYHSIRWLEHSDAGGTTTWYGDNGGTSLQSGMTVKIKA